MIRRPAAAPAHLARLFVEITARTGDETAPEEGAAVCCGQPAAIVSSGRHRPVTPRPSRWQEYLDDAPEGKNLPRHARPRCAVLRVVFQRSAASPGGKPALPCIPIWVQSRVRLARRLLSAGHSPPMRRRLARLRRSKPSDSRLSKQFGTTQAAAITRPVTSPVILFKTRPRWRNTQSD